MAEPVSIISAMTGVFQLIDRIENYSNRYMARSDLASANAELHARLREEYKRAVQIIERIEQGRDAEHSPLRSEITRARLEVFKASIYANKEELDSLGDEISRADMKSRVRRVNVILEKCRTDIMEFFVFVTDTVLPYLRENLSNDQKASTSKISASDAATIPPQLTKASDSYVPRSNVHRNSPRLTLDYNTTDTCEGKLKAAILEGSRSGILGVAAIGDGGVGKTCALRGLAADPEIRQEFPGGILYISLGEDARVSDVINEIANAVKVTGGKQLAEEVRCAKTVAEASTKAGRWFRPHKCLFLVNDLWWRNGITSDVFEDLGNMFPDDSVLVYTTRDKRFLRGTDRIVPFVLRKACGEVAQHMLMASAGFGEDIECPIEREDFRGILQLCNGLPLAIAVAGAAVRGYIGNRAVNEQDAWGDYYLKLKSKEEDIVRGSAAELRLMVDSSLETLESKELKPYDYMFRTFCVFRNQQEVDGQVLQKLWNLPELRDAREVAEMFESSRLVRVRNKTGNLFSVQVHDLVLDIARTKASELQEMKMWFKTLLDNYILPEQTTLAPEVTATEDMELREKGVRMVLSAVFASAGKSLCCKRCAFCFTGGAKKQIPQRREKTMFRQWWNVENDGFILDDLCRVLHGAGETEELLWLLERAQWIVMRLQKSGIHGVKQDLEFGMQAAEKNTLCRTEVVNYLKLLGSAARMSCIHVANNEYEAWYQMYGRLVVHEEACRLTHGFVSEIEERAPRPWIRPSVGFLEGAGGMCLETIRIERCSRVLYVSHSESMMRILWVDKDYIVCITEYDKRYGRERVHRLVPNHLSSDSSCEYRTEISNAWVRSSNKCICGAFFKEDKKMVTGHHDGNIFIWDVGSEYTAEKVLRSTGIVKCVGMSGNGTRIVSGLEGTLCVWDTSNGELDSSLIEAGRGVKCISTSFDGKRVLICLENGDVQTWAEAGEDTILPSEIPNDYVCCVEISGDGGLAVCGTLEGKLRLWNFDSPENSVRTLTGHTREVLCVALSGNGRRLVSGSSDRAVRVWDTIRGVMIGKPFEGHTIRVSHVAMDADGKEIVSISSDATVRVWNVDQMAASDTPERFDNRVRCIAYCGHGNKIVSGSGDGCVRVWDVRSGKIIGNDLHSHKYTVESVAISGNGNVVASLSAEDGTVLVHDLRGRRFPSFGRRKISTADCITVDYDGTLVAIGSEKGLYVLDTRTGRQLWSCTGLSSKLKCIAISKKGTTIACGLTSGNIVVWNTTSKLLESGRTLEGHGEEIRSLVCSRDGKRVVSGSADRTVQVWDVARGEKVGDGFDHDSQVLHVQSDSECSRVVSYDERGHGRLWDVAQKKCTMTSSEASWKETLQGYGIAGFRWLPRGREITTITSRSNDGNEQFLASSERAVIRVGDFYFSNVQSSAFWPFCRVEW